MTIEVVIVSAVRTAIGSFRGALKDVPATKLGQITCRVGETTCGQLPGQVPDRLDVVIHRARGVHGAVRVDQFHQPDEQVTRQSSGRAGRRDRTAPWSRR